MKKEQLKQEFKNSLSDGFKDMEFPTELDMHTIIGFNKLEKNLFGNLYRVYVAEKIFDNPKLVLVDKKPYVLLQDRGEYDKELLEKTQDTAYVSMRDFVFTPYGVIGVNSYKRIIEAEKLIVRINIKFITYEYDMTLTKTIKFKKEYILDNDVNTLVNLYNDLKETINSQLGHKIKEKANRILFKISDSILTNVSIDLLSAMVTKILNELEVNQVKY